MLDTPRKSTDQPQDRLPASATKRNGPDDPPKDAHYSTGEAPPKVQKRNGPDDPPKDAGYPVVTGQESSEDDAPDDPTLPPGY